MNKAIAGYAKGPDLPSLECSFVDVATHILVTIVLITAVVVAVVKIKKVMQEWK